MRYAGSSPRKLREFCKRRGFLVAHEYVDKGISGSRERRPALDTLLADCRKRIVDAVVVYRYDRFARSLRQLVNSLEEFRSLAIEFISIHEAPKLPTFTDEQIAEFLRQKCKDFCDALAGDPEFARKEIQERIKSLVLTPKYTPEGPVLEVSGNVALLRTGDVLVESPMEGIAEHYIGASISLAGVILNPSLPLAA